MSDDTVLIVRIGVGLTCLLALALAGYWVWGEVHFALESSRVLLASHP